MDHVCAAMVLDSLAIGALNGATLGKGSDLVHSLCRVPTVTSIINTDQLAFNNHYFLKTGLFSPMLNIFIWNVDIFKSWLLFYRSWVRSKRHLIVSCALVWFAPWTQGPSFFYNVASSYRTDSVPRFCRFQATLQATNSLHAISALTKIVPPSCCLLKK